MIPTIKRTAHQPKSFSVFEIEGHGQVLVMCDLNREDAGLVVRVLFPEDGGGHMGELTAVVPFSGEYETDRESQIKAFEHLNDPEILAELILPALSGRFDASNGEPVAALHRDSGEVKTVGGKRYDA